MKKFVIMEVHPICNDPERGYEPIDFEADDATWIDPRHVIDGDRLNHCMPRAGETYFGIPQGWTVAAWNMGTHCVVLDPPRKPDPVDPDQAWKDECPLDQWRKENRDKLADWILKAVRKP